MVSKKELIEQCKNLGIKISQSSTKEKILEIIQQNEKTNVTLLEDDGKIVKNIYHLADIHIRYIDRHEEYREVFKKLYEYIREDVLNLKENEENIMVISGDIFHTRDKLASETLILFNEFLKNVTRNVKIFAILGNHDCFNHSGRLDILSGIVDLTLYKNFYLLKESGVYNYSNISFGVSSLLDGKFTKKQNTDKISIALYHGILEKCTMDNGTTAQSEISIEDFKGYDLVLLGDVHKRQFLNKTKTAAYPGSLIQQNFKEEKNHGFLKWELDSLRATFINLENDYSFTTIPMDNNLDLNKINFGKYSRIRLLLNQEDLEKDVKNMISAIEKHTTILSVKNYLKETKIKEVKEGEVDHIDKIDEKEYEIINRMLEDKEYIKEEVIKVHQDMLKNIEEEDLNQKESLPWSIEEVQFKNIFSYGNDILNTIKLDDGISGILASNASGKTNILNTIIYGLFGNIYSRTQNQNNRNIVSKYAKKEDLFVRLTIRFLTGDLYYIERTAKQRSRTKSSNGKEQSLMTETLKFYKEDKELNLSNKLDTEKLLRETLSFMGKEEFILTNMMSNISYGNNMSIISMPGSQLDEVFNNMFNLNKYKLLHKSAKTESKRVYDEIKTNNTRLSMTEESIKKIDIKEINKNLKIAETENEKYKNKSVKIALELEKVETELLKIKQTPLEEDEKSILSKLSENKKLLSEYEGNLVELLNQEEEIDQMFTEYKKIYLDKNYKKITQSPRPSYTVKETIEELDKKISFAQGKRRDISFSSDITNEYIKAKKFIKNIKTEDSLDFDKIKKVIEGLEYEKSIDKFLIETEKREDLLKDLSKEYKDPSLLLKYKKIIEDKEKRDEDVNINIEVDEIINECRKKIKVKALQDAYECKDKLNELSAKLHYIDLHYEILDLDKKLDILKSNSTMNELISRKKELLDELEEIKTKILSNDKSISTFNYKIEQYEELVEEKEKYSPLVIQGEKKLEIYKTYIEITHSKNLPKVLISNIVKSLCQHANKIIYNTTGLLCEIQENEKWEIVVKKDNIYIGPEHCSGYERFIMNTSLKLAFDKFKQLSSIKLFLIDEVIDCVSEDNFDQIDVLLDHLKEHYQKIVIISHNEELKKKINNRINISLDSGVSRIV